MVRRRVRRRQLWRRTRIGALLAGAVLAAGGIVFGIDRMVVALTRYYSSPATHGPSRSNTSTIAAPTSTVPAGPPACNSGQLSGTVANWQETSGTTYEIVTLTDNSSSACTLDGFPSLGANAQNGSALPAPARNVATLGAIPGSAPSTPGPVPLAAGASGWFELAFHAVCTQVLTPGGTTPTSSPGACYPGVSLQVTPPKATSPLLVTEPFRFTYGTDGFEVGPFLGGTPPSSPPIGP